MSQTLLLKPRKSAARASANVSGKADLLESFRKHCVAYFSYYKCLKNRGSEQFPEMFWTTSEIKARIKQLNVKVSAVREGWGVAGKWRECEITFFFDKKSWDVQKVQC